MNSIKIRKNFLLDRETIEKSANKRTGSFIGILDGKIGNSSFKEMKAQHASKELGL